MRILGLNTNYTNHTNDLHRHSSTFVQFAIFVFNFYHANIGVERELPEGAIHRSSGCRYVSLRLLWVSCFAHSKKCAICHNYLSNLNLANFNSMNLNKKFSSLNKPVYNGNYGKSYTNKFGTISTGSTSRAYKKSSSMSSLKPVNY